MFTCVYFIRQNGTRRNFHDGVLVPRMVPTAYVSRRPSRDEKKSALKVGKKPTQTGVPFNPVVLLLDSGFFLVITYFCGKTFRLTTDPEFHFTFSPLALPSGFVVRLSQVINGRLPLVFCSRLSSIILLRLEMTTRRIEFLSQSNSFGQLC